MSSAVMDVETKPGWEETENEIRYRLREPDEFQEGSFRRITLQDKTPHVYAIAGKLKGESALTLQALRFPADEWTLADAKKWLADHPEVKKSLEDTMSQPTTDGTLQDTKATPMDMVDDFGLLRCVCTRHASAADDSRVRRFVASTALRDRYGDEVLVEAWDTKNYMANPVVLWAHNYGEIPLGKAVAIEKTDKALLIDVEFAPVDVNPKSEQVLRAYDAGYMRAVSVGFRSKASEWIDPADEEEAKKLKKEPDIRPGKRFTKVELLELSCVPVPANPQALMQMRRKGIELPEARSFWFVHVEREAEEKPLASDAGTPPAVVKEEAPPAKAAPDVVAAETDKDAPAASPPSPASGPSTPSDAAAVPILEAIVEAMTHILRT